MTLLQDEEWGKWTDREIARQCAVSATLVHDIHRSLRVTRSEEDLRPCEMVCLIRFAFSRLRSNYTRITWSVHMQHQANEAAAIPRLLSEEQVRDLTGLGRTSIWQYSKTGEFPRPLKLVGRRIAWREDEVLAWIESRPRG